MFLKHTGQCTCKWCLYDNVFFNSKHIGQCNCQWCAKDFLIVGAGEPNKQNADSTLYSSNCIEVKVTEDISDTPGEKSTFGFNSSVNSIPTCSSEYITQLLHASDERQSEADSTNSLINPTYGHITISDAETRDSNDSKGLDFSISGSLQRSPFKGSFGNYSLQSLKGATSRNITLQQDDNENHSVNNGLHVQWGLLLTSPLLALPDINGTSIEHSNMKQWVQLAYKKAPRHNQPNYAGARIRVVSQLNVQQWRALLKDYKYNRVTDYIEFGFPLSLDYHVFQYNQQTQNHPSALNFPSHVDNYLKTEQQFKAVAGPFNNPPFKQFYTSPMMTRAKPDGSRRLIVNLSWPHGANVNSAIPDDIFDDNECKLKYPTLDNIMEAISTMGSDALIYKIDLKRGYRNLRSDPRDLSVLGWSWRGEHYVDISILFGLNTGAAACQKVMDSITHLMQTSGHWTCAYLDDIVGVSPPSHASSGFLSLNNLRLLKLAIRSVAHNAPLSFWVKGIFTVEKLKHLMRSMDGIPDEPVFKAVMLFGFFGFYRLSKLVPPSKAAFSASRFLTHGHVVWGPPGAHIITKCTKSMQTSGHSQVVQLPRLKDSRFAQSLLSKLSSPPGRPTGTFPSLQHQPKDALTYSQQLM